MLLYTTLFQVHVKSPVFGRVMATDTHSSKWLWTYFHAQMCHSGFYFPFPLTTRKRQDFTRHGRQMVCLNHLPTIIVWEYLNLNFRIALFLCHTCKSCSLSTRGTSCSLQAWECAAAPRLPRPAEPHAPRFPVLLRLGPVLAGCSLLFLQSFFFFTSLI